MPASGEFCRLLITFAHIFEALSMVFYIHLIFFKNIHISEKNFASITRIHLNLERFISQYPKNTLNFHKRIPYPFNYLDNIPTGIPLKSFKGLSFHLYQFTLMHRSERIQIPLLAGHQRPASETPFKWRFAGGLTMGQHSMLNW